MSPHPSTIFLYGPSGTGKTATGRLLAESLALPFHDLDIEIETQSRRKIPEIFATDGEAAFREMERAQLEGLLSMEGVISLGGGALTHPPTRALAEKSGRVLLLIANPVVMLARLQADTSNPRPLLQGDAKTKLDTLLARRAEHYAEFPLRLDTTMLAPEQAAWEAQILLGMFRITGMGQPYDVRVEPGGLDSLGSMMFTRGLRGPVAIVTDENVGKLYAERTSAVLQSSRYPVQVITIPPGEQYKTLETVTRLWEGFLLAGVERGSTVVALGGGVVGDLTGFAAAMWLRGVRWVNVPTTLLAMCDSSLGGKTGADLAQGKNLVGAFHSPSLVLADPDLLVTLPEAEMRNGLAEVLKHGVIADPALFDMFATHPPLSPHLRPPTGYNDQQIDSRKWRDERGVIVRRSMAVKVQVIQEDPYEKGYRECLNLGHTIGHGVELASGFRLRHGEAVAIGMVSEARLAEAIGIAEPGLADRIATGLRAAGLPTEIPADIDRNAILRASSADKKRAEGKVKFALPVRIGEVKVGVEIDHWKKYLLENL